MPHIYCLAINFDFEPLVEPFFKLGSIGNLFTVFASPLINVALDVGPVREFFIRFFEGRLCVLLGLGEVLGLECVKIGIFSFEER